MAAFFPLFDHEKLTAPSSIGKTQSQKRFIWPAEVKCSIAILQPAAAAFQPLIVFLKGSYSVQATTITLLSQF